MAFTVFTVFTDNGLRITDYGYGLKWLDGFNGLECNILTHLV